MPFTLACLALTALIGFPGRFVTFYLDTIDIEKGFTLAISDSGFATIPVGTESLWTGVARTITFNLFLFLILYSGRYLRRRIVRAESELAPLSPRGEQGFHEAFGLVSSPAGASVFTLFLGVPYVLPRILSSAGFFTLFSSVVGTSLDAFVIATLLWEYLYVLGGLRRFGMADIQLKRYSMDRMFGLRPLGSISVTFGAVFIGLASVALIGGVLSNDPLNMVVVVVVLSIGLVMLFLPLNGTHKKMVEQKHVEQIALQQRLREVISRRSDSDGGGVESRLDEISRLMKVQLERDEIRNIPTWPFDTRAVERMAAVVIAVITVVLARITQLALKL